MARQTGHQGTRRSGAFQEHELMVCDLCSSLNLATNKECFVCGWNGYFERNHAVVRTAVVIAIQQHGRLELENLTDIRTYREVKPDLRERVMRWISRLRRWLSG